MQHQRDVYGAGGPLEGPRFEFGIEDVGYPPILREMSDPPARLFGIGDAAAMQPGVAVIGARKATPYGITCAKRFASRAAIRGLVVISGGARGCDQAAHTAAVEAHMPTVVVFGGAADVVYPKRGRPLFEHVVALGGAVISEHPWGTPPMRPYFVQRNRIIAGLARLLLITEAGMPSGTMSTADAALSQGKEVAVVPGAITSPNSRGSNRLLCQGAIPVIDEQSLDDALDTAFSNWPMSMLEPEKPNHKAPAGAASADPLLAALLADAYTPEELTAYFGFSCSELLARLSQYEMRGIVQRGRDGRYMAL